MWWKQDRDHSLWGSKFAFAFTQLTFQNPCMKPTWCTCTSESCFHWRNLVVIAGKTGGGSSRRTSPTCKLQPLTLCQFEARNWRNPPCGKKMSLTRRTPISLQASFLMTFLLSAVPKGSSMYFLLLNGSKGFTMVNKSHGFNELSHMTMLWTLHHLWPKGSWFSFNCYCHNAMLIVHNPGHRPIIFWSCKGIKQGDLLAMVLLATRVHWWLCPHGQAHHQCQMFVVVETGWAVVWILSRTWKIVACLLPRGWSRGKSGACGRRFVGSVLSEQLMCWQIHWLGGRHVQIDLADGWVFGITQLATVNTIFPQMAYTGLVISLEAK